HRMIPLVKLSQKSPRLVISLSATQWGRGTGRGGAQGSGGKLDGCWMFDVGCWMFSLFRSAICLALCLLGSSVMVHAASTTWTGATDTNWSTPGNWSPAATPTVIDIATFNSAGHGRTTIS